MNNTVRYISYTGMYCILQFADLGDDGKLFHICEIKRVVPLEIRKRLLTLGVKDFEI